MQISRRSSTTALLRALAATGAALALAVTPASAAANARDAADTHSLVLASYALARATNASIPVAQTRMQRFNRKVAGECPKAAAGTLENAASEPMTYEVAVALWSISYGTAAGPIKRFAAAVRPLRFSSSRFERVLRSYVSNLLAMSTIPLPNLCADIRRWTASGFTTVPANVNQLDRRVEDLSLPEMPWKLLAPYMNSHDASVLPFVKRSERRVGEEEFLKGQDDYYAVLETVGLPP